MEIAELIDQWEQCEPERRAAFLASHSSSLSADGFKALKERTTEAIWEDADHAHALADSLVDAAARTGNRIYRGYALMALANVHAFGLGQYRTAADTYNTAAAVFRDAGDEALAAQAPIGQIYALGMLGDYDEAIALGQRLREAARERGDWATYAKAINNLAIACARRGEYARAMNLYDELAEVLETHLNEHPIYPDMVFPLHLNRSNMLRYLNDYEQAVAEAQVALALAQEYENDVRIARARDSLGLTYYFLGRYNDSIACFRKARATFRAANLERDAVVAQLFEARCLLSLNEFDDVVQTCGDVIGYSEDAGLTYEEAIARTYRATAHRQLENLDLAQTDLDRSAAIFEDDENDVWAGQVYLEMAYLRLATGRLHEASVAASAAQVCFERQELKIERAQAVLAQATVAERQENLNVSRRAYRDVLTLGQEEDLAWLVYPACYGLARLARTRGYKQRARVRLDQAIDAIERLRAGMAVDLRIAFLADKLDVYNDAVALSLDGGDLDGALQYVERAKSRALYEMFRDENSIRLQALDPQDQEMVEEINQLRERRRWLEQRALHRTPIADRDTSEQSERDTWREEARAVEARLESLFRELQVHNAAYTASRTLTALPDEPVAAHLPPATALIEYFALDDALWALVVNQEEMHVRRLVDTATVQDYLSRWRLHLTQAARFGVSGGLRDAHIHAAQKLLGRMYEAVFAPLRGWCLSMERLYVVPHGVLHYLPLAALYDAERDAYLAETFSLARLPSAGVLAALAARRRQYDERALPLVIGHSQEGALPYTVEEARTVREMIAGDCYVEDAARRRLLLDSTVWRPVVHIAAHGLFRAEAPLFSAVYLADGPLTTLDLFNTRLPTDVLVLSACESGLGVVQPGDEVMGLSRACLHAGAQSLLMSLWHINDLSTRDVMTAFYRQLTDGASPANALTAAQRVCIASDTMRHPFYWAAFTIAGDAFTPVSLTGGLDG